MKNHAIEIHVRQDLTVSTMLLVWSQNIGWSNFVTYYYIPTYSKFHIPYFLFLVE